METNSEKCPYCYSKLKKSKLECPKCRVKIFTKETRIKSIPLSAYIFKFVFLTIFLSPFYYLSFLAIGYRAYIMGFGWMVCSLMMTLVLIHVFIQFVKKPHNTDFLISSKSIQFIKKEAIIMEFLWKNINSIVLIREKYYDRSRRYSAYGYNLKFQLPKEEVSVRPWCLNFDRETPQEKIADLIRDFSNYMKTEIIVSIDLENVYSGKDICLEEKPN